MKNFLDIDTQIEENEKFLAFYYENYKKTLDKFNLLIVIYSVVFVFFIQVMKFPCEKYKDVNLLYVCYILLIVTFLVLLGISLFNSYFLLKPLDVAYMNEPKSFYKDTYQQYKILLGTEDENIINEYIKSSYLNELEVSVTNNRKLFEDKGGYYYKAFVNLLRALLPYVICIGIVNFYPVDAKPSKTEIINYKEIAKEFDSLTRKQLYNGNTGKK